MREANLKDELEDLTEIARFFVLFAQRLPDGMTGEEDLAKLADKIFVPVPYALRDTTVSPAADTKLESKKTVNVSFSDVREEDPSKPKWFSIKQCYTVCQGKVCYRICVEINSDGLIVDITISIAW